MRDSVAITAAQIASRIDRGLPRRALRRAARAAGWLNRRGEHWLPWQVRRRLGRIAANGPGWIVVHNPAPVGSRQALLVTHDLSASGAPKLVYEMAVAMIADGWAVTVLSPSDGDFRAALVGHGACVVVAPELNQDKPPLLAALAGHQVADVLICNTINTHPAVRLLAGRIPTLWYIHEVSLLRDMLGASPDVARSLALPALLWAGSDLPAAILREVRPDVAVVPYGLEPLGEVPAAGRAPGEPLRIGLFGSYEARKGQDLAVAAMASLADAVRAELRLVMYGRELEPAFTANVKAASAAIDEITASGELGPGDYRRAMLDTDGVLVASREDTLPLVSLDALGSGRVLMCTPTTGTSAYVEAGVSAFVAPSASEEGIAAMLAEAVTRRSEWQAIGEAGRAVFTGTFSKAAFDRKLREALGFLLQRGGGDVVMAPDQRGE